MVPAPAEVSIFRRVTAILGLPVTVNTDRAAIVTLLRPSVHPCIGNVAVGTIFVVTRDGPRCRGAAVHRTVLRRRFHQGRAGKRHRIFVKGRTVAKRNPPTNRTRDSWRQRPASLRARGEAMQWPESADRDGVGPIKRASRSADRSGHVSGEPT